jgi:uncharacterized phage protein gp47/JayE
MTFGLDNTGFTLKRLEDIESEIDADLVNTFGNVRTDYASVFGQLKAIMSKKFADLWELLQTLWLSYSLQSEGLALDSVVQFSGVTRLPSTKSEVVVTFAGDEGTTIAVGTIVRSSITGVQFTLNSAVNINIPVAETIDLSFIALEYGALSAPAASVTQLITPISGVTSITNAVEAVQGRETETDDELRTRFIQARSRLGYSRFDAVISRIVQEVAGVVSAAAVENTSDITDSDGLPPHSFEIIVDCPTSIEQAVANKIWDVKPLGINTFGDITKDVTDSQGKVHSISFSKITDVYAWINIVLTYSSEIAFPANGVSQINDNLLAYGKTVSIGQDFLIQALYSSIYAVPGISSAAVTIDVTPSAGDTPSYGSSNIVVAAKERLIFATTRITIV